MMAIGEMKWIQLFIAYDIIYYSYWMKQSDDYFEILKSTDMIRANIFKHGKTRNKFCKKRDRMTK